MEKTLSLNRKIALTGALSALVVVLGMPPMHLGMISIGAYASITIMHIPVLLAVMLMGMYSAGKKITYANLFSGMIVGAVFGIFSLMLAAISPTGALDPLFVNPLISVLPRILLAVVCWILWTLLNLIPHMPKVVSTIISAFLSTLGHTCLVIGSLYIFYNGKITEAMGGKAYIAGLALMLPNALIEAVAAAVVCAAVMGTVIIATGKKSKLSQEEQN